MWLKKIIVKSKIKYTFSMSNKILSKEYYIVNPNPAMHFFGLYYVFNMFSLYIY